MIYKDGKLIGCSLMITNKDTVIFWHIKKRKHLKMRKTDFCRLYEVRHGS